MFRDFQEAIVIVFTNPILWIAVLMLVEALGLTMLTVFLGVVKRIW